MRMRFEPLSAGFGVEATGLEVARLSPGQFAEIEQAFFAAQVLVLRGQHLAPGQFLDFARRFGPPEPHVIDQFHHPEHADILILSNRRTADGEPAGLADAGTYFHTDYSYLDVPARCTTLYSIEVPRKGGDTLFANQYAAYDDLPEATRRRIEGLVGLHHYGNRDDLNERSRTVASVLSEEQQQKVTWVRHPIVRRHPVTGRKALYAISGTSFGIEGMDEAQALALLDELKQHATREKYQLRLKYGVGDVVIWDNASLLHSATLIDPNDPRTLWRITIKETRRNP
jgi:taurine dioxygenase